MQSKAASVKEYLAELPDDRREAIDAVRKAILANMDSDYEEGMQYGMIGFYVPHRIYPAGYHCDPKQPLPFVCLASQKNYMSLYMMYVYGDAPLAKWFQTAWAKTGKKLDMGKSCIRFKRLDDLPLEVVGESIRRMPVKKLIAYYETAIRDRVPPKQSKKAVSAKKTRTVATRGASATASSKAAGKKGVKKRAARKS